MDEYEDMGVQNDGEATPVVEAEPAPVTTEEAAPAEVTETAETETTEDEPDEHPKKKSGSQRWKEKAQRAEEEKEFWRQEALKAKNPETSTPQVIPGKPTSDQFATHEDWVEALADWKITEREQKAEAVKAQHSWQEKATKAKEKYEDFEDALESAPQPAPAVLKVIQKSPVGADLAYHLATHPEDYRRINSMAPEDSAYELGQLALKFSGSPAPPKPKQITKAPAPIAPVASSGVVTPLQTNSRLEDF